MSLSKNRGRQTHIRSIRDIKPSPRPHVTNTRVKRVVYRDDDSGLPPSDFDDEAAYFGLPQKNVRRQQEARRNNSLPPRSVRDVKPSQKPRSYNPNVKRIPLPDDSDSQMARRRVQLQRRASDPIQPRVFPNNVRYPDRPPRERSNSFTDPYANRQDRTPNNTRYPDRPPRERSYSSDDPYDDRRDRNPSDTRNPDRPPRGRSYHSDDPYDDRRNRNPSDVRYPDRPHRDRSYNSDDPNNLGRDRNPFDTRYPDGPPREISHSFPDQYDNRRDRAPSNTQNPDRPRRERSQSFTGPYHKQRDRNPNNTRYPDGPLRERSYSSEDPHDNRSVRTGSASEYGRPNRRNYKNKMPDNMYNELPNVPARRNEAPVPKRPMIVNKSPEAVAVIPTTQTRFTPDMNKIRQKAPQRAPIPYNKYRPPPPVHIDPDKYIDGAGSSAGCNTSFLMTIWAFIKFLQFACCIAILVCGILEGSGWNAIFWVILVASLGIMTSFGTWVYHLVRGHLKENRCVLITELSLYLFMSLCVLSVAILATIRNSSTQEILCITIVAYIAALWFGIDTIITGSWIGARTYTPSIMRPRPVLYPPNYQPRVYYPKLRRDDVIYERPRILLDPWEEKIHYNDYRPRRYPSFNLNNPPDDRLPDRVDVRYYQNKPPRYQLKPLYRRDYTFPEDNWDYRDYRDYVYDDVRTVPVDRRYIKRDYKDDFRSFPDAEYRRYQRFEVNPILGEEDLLRDDSQSHVTIFHHRQPVNRRAFPKLYHHKRRNWKFPDFDNESRFIDFTSENELDSNLPSVGTNEFSVRPNYHKRRDYKLPNFKSYDDWRIQKHRAKQLSTIPAKPKLRREHFWSVDSIPSDNRRHKREYPNFRTHADWNVPRDRHSISTNPNPFPDKDDYPSSVGPIESRVGDKFSTSPFPDPSLVDTSSLIRPYKPRPRPDPELGEPRPVNDRNNPAPGVPGSRNTREDRISNRGSDNASLAANRSANSQRMKPIFNKDKEPKATKSVGSV